MKNKIFAVAALSLVSCSAAFAADLPARSEPYAPAPVVAPPQVYNWSGFYAGLNAGYGWGSHRRGASNLLKGPTGGVWGGQMGYNYQMNNVVLGIEADLYGSSMSAKRTFPGPIITRSSVNWGTSLRGRFGVAFERALVFGTLGYAYGNIKGRVVDTVAPVFTSTSYSRGGIVMGAGIEYAFTNNISVKTEYLYTRYGSKFIFGGPYATSSGMSTSIIRAGVNYHF
ncbi:MAG: porin family protein [Hyphomicrobiales bacterium]|nr:porin family protein [Hyphomicrobiales bacterium]